MSGNGATVAFDARYVSDRYHGIGRHAFGLVEAMSRLDSGRSYVIFHDPSAPNERFDLMGLSARPNVRLRAVRMALYSPREQLQWPLLIRQEGVRLFHSPYVTMPLASPVKSVITVHDVILERHPEFVPPSWQGRLYRFAAGMAIRRSSAILTVSSHSQLELDRVYPAARGKSTVLYSGVDATFQPDFSSGQSEQVRRRYRLPDRFILALGTGRPHKNIETLLDAFARLPDRSLFLVAAGPFDTRFPDELQRRAERLGVVDRLIRPGLVREGDLATLYALATVFVFPSIVEGFGLPVIEAMACGTPVITSSTSAMPEAAGDAGVLVEPTNVASMATAIQRVVGDEPLRARMREKGLAQAARFTWDQAARVAIDVYRGLQ